MSFVFRGIQVDTVAKRIYKEERKPNLHYYEIALNDDMMIHEAKVCHIVLDNNFYGTMISEQPLEHLFNKDGYIRLILLEAIKILNDNA